MGTAGIFSDIVSQSDPVINAKDCPVLSGIDGHHIDALAIDLLDYMEEALSDQLNWDSEPLNGPALCVFSGISQRGPAGMFSSPASSASDTFPAAFKHGISDSDLHTWVTLDSYATCPVLTEQSPIQTLPDLVQQCKQHVQTAQPSPQQSGSVDCTTEDDDYGKLASSNSQLCVSESDTEERGSALSNRLCASASAAKTSKKRQPGKRGRPPKTPGVFSKGYMAIKRYRQRKKGMVEQMECDIAVKQQELAALEEEHRRLQLRQQVLEIAVTAQDAIVADLAKLKQFFNISNSTHIGSKLVTTCSSRVDCSTTSSQAAAALHRALNAENFYISYTNSSATGRDWTAVLLRTEAELQRLKQYTQMQRVQSSSAALDRYKLYVADSALKLAEEASVRAHQPHQTTASLAAAAAAAVTGVTPIRTFAAFPLSVVQAALLWDPARTGTAAQLPIPDAVKQVPDGLGLLSLNLENGQYELIDEGFWRQVAAQLTLLPEQRQQLQLAWQLLAAAQERLDLYKHQLQHQLQFWAAVQAPPTPAAAAVAALSCVGQSYSTGVQLASAVESYLLTARVSVLAHSWCFKSMLDTEQIAKLCVACWPYYSVPHMRVVISHLLSQ